MMPMIKLIVLTNSARTLQVTSSSNHISIIFNPRGTTRSTFVFRLTPTEGLRDIILFVMPRVYLNRPFIRTTMYISILTQAYLIVTSQFDGHSSMIPTDAVAY